MSELMVDKALELAAVGFRVFPLDETTCLPIFKDWPSKATTDPKQIDRWWRDPVNEWHQPHNIGIATGRGVLVIDVDLKNGGVGDQSIAMLEDVYGPLPDGPTVRTPSGGLHRFFKVNEDLGNTAGKKLGKNLDTRCERGYVVGAGSLKNGLPYSWTSGHSMRDMRLPELPGWCATLLKAETRKKDAPKNLELDTVSACSQAREYLKRVKPAISFDGGNDHTYSVACGVRDFGISEPACLELMLESWNERCEPPWTIDDLARIVGNAFQYGQNAPGCRAAANDFDEILETETAPEPASELAPNFVKPFDPLVDIPKRQWIVDSMLCRKHLTVMVAPGGVGKTTFDINLALSIATGRSDITGFRVIENTKTWYCSGEDDIDELKRRLAAAMQMHGISWTQIADKLAINSGQDTPFKVLKRDGRFGSLKRTVDHKAIIERIREHEIGLLILDPLQELHDGDENDNGEMHAVASAVREIAWNTGCAVMLVHHTRKRDGSRSDGHAGNMDSARGGSSLQGACRIMITMDTMTVDDAKKVGIHEDARHRYAQLDVTKNNLGPTGRQQWLERVSVPLGRPDIEDDNVLLGEVERVGALRPIQLSKDRPVPLTALDVVRNWPKRRDEVKLTELARLFRELPALQDESDERLCQRLWDLGVACTWTDGYQLKLDGLKTPKSPFEASMQRTKCERPDGTVVPDPAEELIYDVSDLREAPQLKE